MMLALRRPRRPDGLVVRSAADRLPADGGPGLRDRRHPAPRRGVADADPGGRREGQRHPQEDCPGCRSWFLIGGQSILDQAVASNAAAMYITFTPWEERTGKPGLSMEEILANFMGQAQQIREASIFAFPPPAIQGLGVAGGFQMQLEDRGGVGLNELQQVLNEMVRDGNAQTGLKGLQSTFRAGVPVIYADVDREKAKSLGVPLESVFATLQTALGSAYVNDFNKFGRTFQVRVQADQRFRLEPEDIRRLEVRDKQGKMVPLGTLVRVEKRLGPQIIPRYNLYPSASISGGAAPGYSSGQALKLMDQMAARKLPAAMGTEWTAMSYQEKRVGGQAIYVFAPGGADGLPRPGRPVRELDAARRGHPRRAAGLAGHGDRRRDPRDGQQHLHADRRRADHRPGEQERHPDRRVRPRAAGPRPIRSSTRPSRRLASGSGRS